MSSVAKDGPAQFLEDSHDCSHCLEINCRSASDLFQQRHVRAFVDNNNATSTLLAWQTARQAGKNFVSQPRLPSHLNTWNGTMLLNCFMHRSWVRLPNVAQSDTKAKDFYDCMERGTLYSKLHENSVRSHVAWHSMNLHLAVGLIRDGIRYGVLWNLAMAWCHLSHTLSTDRSCRNKLYSNHVFAERYESLTPTNMSDHHAHTNPQSIFSQARAHDLFVCALQKRRRILSLHRFSSQPVQFQACYISTDLGRLLYSTIWFLAVSSTQGSAAIAL